MHTLLLPELPGAYTEYDVDAANTDSGLQAHQQYDDLGIAWRFSMRTRRGQTKA